jgi:hypothetical protein
VGGATSKDPSLTLEDSRIFSDVGVKGYVVPEMGGWAAGSILGAQAVRVSLDGKGASESTVVELLKETMKRRSASVSK